MNRDRQIKLVVRWSIVTATTFALFWTIFYLNTGHVPVFTITDSFHVSRVWDILFGPALVALLVLALTSGRRRQIKEKSERTEGLGDGPAVLLTFGMALGLLVGLIHGLVYGMAIGLILGLGFALVIDLLLSLLAGISLALRGVAGAKLWAKGWEWLPNKWLRAWNWLMAK